ncbi:MAG: hypothetical protein ACP5IL_04360 [Syntrophobacteraceae bacterium]
MTKIKLGGIKILEGCSYLGWSCEEARNPLTDICAHLGSEGINLSQVLHIAQDATGRSSTSLCTQSGKGFTSYFLVKRNTGLEPILKHDTTILSVFPHDRSPRVMGALLELMGQERMHPACAASSPSAMSIVVALEDMKATIDSIFSAFEFPAYGSPLKWESAYLGKEQLFKDVVSSYEEQDIKVYGVLDQPGLDFWALDLERGQLKQAGDAFRQIDTLGAKMAFLAADFSDPEQTALCFCLPALYRAEATKALDCHLPRAKRTIQDGVGVFFHGPHFGDRHRIAAALTESMETAGIEPLAFSCAVHSISVILKAKDLHEGLEAIKTKFHVPCQTLAQNTGKEIKR